MTDHAKLSPSSAYRWFKCPGSIRAQAGLPDDSNEYAREGTAAHTLCERCLISGSDASYWIGTAAGRIAVDYMVDGVKKTQLFTVNREMAEAVQVYLDFVRTIEHGEMWVEQKVGLGTIAPILDPVWGTADCTVYVASTRTLYIVDYKHGRGKVVDVDGNLQLRIYALAAWATFRAKVKIDKVVVVIVQPRAGDAPVRQAEYSAVELLDFAQDVIEAVERTREDNPPLVAGSHCDFCKVKATCAAYRDQALAVAQDEFAMVPAQNLSLEECVKILEKAEYLEDWIKSVRAFLHQTAENGGTVPGYKLVPKRGQRVWKLTKEEVVAKLAPLVTADSELYEEPKLRSVAQMEAVVGKKAIPADLVMTVSSGYNLVKDADSRPAITLHPGDDFIDITDTL